MKSKAAAVLVAGSVLAITRSASSITVISRPPTPLIACTNASKYSGARTARTIPDLPAAGASPVWVMPASRPKGTGPSEGVEKF